MFEWNTTARLFVRWRQNAIFFHIHQAHDSVVCVSSPFEAHLSNIIYMAFILFVNGSPAFSPGPRKCIRVNSARFEFLGLNLYASFSVLFAVLLLLICFYFVSSRLILFCIVLFCVLALHFLIPFYDDIRHLKHINIHNTIFRTKTPITD